MEAHEQPVDRANEQGFTLIELLIAIVVVGILTAVAIVGISSLVDSGENAACEASRDAAQTAAAVYRANNNGAAPATLEAMEDDELQVTGGVVIAGDVMTGNGWSITYTPATNTFTACPA